MTNFPRTFPEYPPPAPTSFDGNIIFIFLKKKNKLNSMHVATYEYIDTIENDDTKRSSSSNNKNV